MSVLLKMYISQKLHLMVEVNVLETLQISPFPDILAAKAVGIYSSFSHLILQDPKKQ